MRFLAVISLGLVLSACGGSASVHDAALPIDAGMDYPFDAAGDPLLVATAQGAAMGTYASDGTTRVWRGLPYAGPPVNDLRWKPPTPPASWSGVRAASQFGNYCVQPPASGTTPVGDEDCLYLNVWSSPAAHALPVIVFIHGGDWISGAGSAPLYDGAYLAAHTGAVIVTINYRLGALGWLALSELATEDPNHTTGDYGLLDQIAALEWVKTNIAAFGGDPQRVTIWGQSAGGWSVAMQTASPLSHGLFAGAVSESGGTFTRPLAKMETISASFASGLGCTGADVLSCLRALPAAQVATGEPANSSDGWGPVIDGYVLTEQPYATMAAGHAAQVPLLLGDTADEYADPAVLSIVPSVASITDPTAYENACNSLFGATVGAMVVDEYPVASFASASAAYEQMVDDWSMLCESRRVARAMSTPAGAKVWRYLYTHTDGSGALMQFGPAHAVDLPFWFHNFSAVSGFTPTPNEETLSTNMIAMLSRFAATGDPNDATATWPQYDASSDPYLVLDTAITTASGLHATLCDFWDENAGGF